MKTCAVAVLLCLSRLATAEEITLDRTCVEIDGAQDGLAAPDRERASELLRRVLEREHLFVVTGGCTETYVLSHERTTDGYVVRVRSSAGKRRMTVPTLDELSIKYQKLVRSLLAARAAQQQPPMADSEARAATATNRDESDPYPALDVRSDESFTVLPTLKRSVWYANVGGQLTGGVAASFGYRRAYAVVSVDLAVNVRASDGGTDSHSFSAELLEYKTLSPATKVFGGGGLSAGKIERGDPTTYYGNSRDFYWGEGIHAELTAGVHVGKAHGTQFLTQVDITLPFYRLGNDNGMKDYVPTATVTAGLGF